MEDGRTDGYLVDNRCWGSYMHGILDNPAVLDYLAEGLAKEDASLFNYAEFKEKQYDKLADHVRAHVDMDAIYRSLTE
jgi:adenosylcobyric acid synthase